jgi:hypothetical protein
MWGQIYSPVGAIKVVSALAVMQLNKLSKPFMFLRLTT